MSQIVLINIGTSDRAEIGRALSKLSLCKPKVIGINVLFIDYNHGSSDTILSYAISKSKNTVLVTNVNDGKLYKSDSFFSQQSLAEGLMFFGFTNGIVDRYEIFTSYNNELLWSFPATVASYFDPKIANNIMDKALGNEFYEIKYKYHLTDFKVIKIEDLSSIDCSALTDRIVLLGYLGPTEEDLFVTEKDIKTYSTVILANCIENIMSDYFVKVDSN